MKRMTNTVGTSNKFWEVTVDDRAVTIRWGRIGTSGQTRIKRFDSAAEAIAHRDKQLGAKLKKGYLIDAPAPAPAAMKTFGFSPTARFRFMSSINMLLGDGVGLTSPDGLKLIVTALAAIGSIARSANVPTNATSFLLSIS